MNKVDALIASMAAVKSAVHEGLQIREDVIKKSIENAKVEYVTYGNKWTVLSFDKAPKKWPVEVCVFIVNKQFAACELEPFKVDSHSKLVEELRTIGSGFDGPVFMIIKYNDI